MKLHTLIQPDFQPCNTDDYEVAEYDLRVEETNNDFTVFMLAC